MAQFNDNIPIAAPPGFRFQPTDQELVSYFLFNKLTGTLPPSESSLIPFCDLYSHDQLSHIFQSFSCNPIFPQDELYFFAQLSKTNGRIKRSVGVDGGWHGEDSGVKIPVQVVFNQEYFHTEAVKKRFSYRKKGSKENCGCIMAEFSLPEFSKEFVVCRLKKRH